MTKADCVHSTPRILTPNFPPPPFRPKPITIFDIAVHQLQAMLELHKLRRQAEQEVERLLNFLDMTDGYTLSECEPSLGFPEQHPSAMWWDSGTLTTTPGNTYDGEDCDDDASIDDGPIDGDGDEEPSLGSIPVHEHQSQVQWAVGSASDRECDPAESGVADMEALYEINGKADWQGHAYV